MISFLLFFFGLAFSIGSFLLGLNYIQDIPLHPELTDSLNIQLSLLNFGSNINLGIGLILVTISAIVIFTTWKWYRKLLVHEIRKGLWNYLLITSLQAFSFYIIFRLINTFYTFQVLIHIGTIFLLILFLILRICWYGDYYGKKRFFKI